MPKPLLTPAELRDLLADPNRWVQDTIAAEITGIPAPSLRRLRFHGKGPRYAKIGSSVRYQIGWLQEFMDARVVETSDTAKIQPPETPAPIPDRRTSELQERIWELETEIARLLQKLEAIRAIATIEKV